MMSERTELIRQAEAQRVRMINLAIQLNGEGRAREAQQAAEQAAKIKRTLDAIRQAEGQHG